MNAGNWPSLEEVHRLEVEANLTRLWDRMDAECQCEGPNEATNFEGYICPLCTEHKRVKAYLETLSA